MRKIIHIDCDCFYAALEMRDDPSLRGKALAIGGSPGKHGMVATCNYEARAYGVRSAMAMRTAPGLCPNLPMVHPHFDIYRAVPGQIHAIFRDYTDLIEPLSLDKAYLDVSASPHFADSATRIAQNVRRRVAEGLHITVSTGVASDKFLAKVAGDWRKPDGLFVIIPKQIDGFVAELPMTKLHGVGKVTAERLARTGVHTYANLRQGSKLSLMREFGSFDKRPWGLAHGVDERPVEVGSRRQSVSVERTLDRDLPGLAACLEGLPTLPGELDGRLQRLDGSYRPDKPFVKPKFHDFTQTMVEQSSAEHDLKSYRQLLGQASTRGNRPVRLIGIGVRLLDLQDAHEQLRLF